MAAASLGALVCAVGLAVIAGWYLHLPILFQIRPDWPPVQFNAAVGIAAMGLGLVASAIGNRAAAGFLSLVPLAVGGITLLTWVLDLTPGIDELLFKHYVTTGTLIPGRMPINNALGLLLGGAALLVAAFPPSPAVATTAWTLGLIAVFRGAVGTLWAMLDLLGYVPDYLGTTHMTLHVSSCVLLSGTALILLNQGLRQVAREGHRIWELPILAGVAVLMVSLLLWQALSVAENTRARLATQDAVQQLATAIEENTRALSGEITRTARHAGRESGVIPRADWEIEATDYIRSNAWLSEILWVNADGSMRFRVSHPDGDPHSHPAPPSGRVLLADPAFTAAVQSGDVGLVRGGAAGSIDRNDLAYLIAPTDPGGEQGALGFATHLDALFGALAGETARGFNVAITDGGNVVFSRGEPGPRAVTRPAFDETAEVLVFGRRWVLEVSPGAGTIGGPAASLPGFVFLFGAVLSLLIAVALRYASVVRAQSYGILEAGSRLQREVEERRRAEISARDSEARAACACRRAAGDESVAGSHLLG